MLYFGTEKSTRVVAAQLVLSVRRLVIPRNQPCSCMECLVMETATGTAGRSYWRFSRIPGGLVMKL
jgi:hypothetical protein